VSEEAKKARRAIMVLIEAPRPPPTAAEELGDCRRKKTKTKKNKKKTKKMQPSPNQAAAGARSPHIGSGRHRRHEFVCTRATRWARGEFNRCGYAEGNFGNSGGPRIGGGGHGGRPLPPRILFLDRPSA